MRGVTHGACDFLIKPVRAEGAKPFCVHVHCRLRALIMFMQHSMLRGSKASSSPQNQNRESYAVHRTPAELRNLWQHVVRRNRANWVSGWL